MAVVDRDLRSGSLLSSSRVATISYDELLGYRSSSHVCSGMGPCIVRYSCGLCRCMMMWVLAYMCAGDGGKEDEERRKKVSLSWIRQPL